MVSPSWPVELLAAREELKTDARVDDRRLMPAWRRYIGAFYKAAGESLPNAVAAAAHIVILSGGYGVVRADEPIGWYDRKLKLSDWRSHVLENALVSEARRLHARSVIAFAGRTTSYADLVRTTPWHLAGVVTPLLVTVVLADGDGNARTEVPRRLGLAFRAFWQQRPESYPPRTHVERLVK